MQKQWNFEFMSWVFVLVFIILVLYPVYYSVDNEYRFYITNIFSIILFLNYTRYIFLLGYTPFGRVNWIKLVFIFTAIPLFLYQIDNLYDFQRFLDEEGTVTLFENSFDMSNYNFGKYIKYQYLFFCIGALVTIVLMPLRMIISFWRTTNTADKV